MVCSRDEKPILHDFASYYNPYLKLRGQYISYKMRRCAPLTVLKHLHSSLNTPAHCNSDYTAQHLPLIKKFVRKTMSLHMRSLESS